jgi:peptidyl-tRNA hydrolase
MLSKFVAFLVGLFLAFLVRRFCERSPPPSSPAGSDFQKRCSLPRPTTFPETEPRFVAGIRTDVKLPHSKISDIMAQLVIDAVTSHLPENARGIGEWYYCSQAKICTKVPSKEVMDDLVRSATELNVPFVTHSENGEILAIGVGPAGIETVNQVTGNLKLL